MNKTLISVVFVALVMALALSACQPGGDTNVNSSLTTNKNTPVEPVDTASVEAELMKLERAWAGANQAHDAATIRNLLADDVVMIYPDGTTGTKTDEIGMAESKAFTMESWDVADTKVTVLDRDAAFVTGRGIIKKGSLKDPKTGKTIDITGDYRFMDVYAKRNGKWVVVGSQATKIVAPASVIPPVPIKTAPKP